MHDENYNTAVSILNVGYDRLPGVEICLANAEKVHPHAVAEQHDPDEGSALPLSTFLGLRLVRPVC